MKKANIFLIMGLVFINLVSGTVIFEDDFSDGDYTNTPEWILTAGGNTLVENEEFVHNGDVIDTSDRYWSILYSYINFSADDKLIFSYRGLLKSQGNPQEGRGILLVLLGTNGNRYDLRIQDGFTSGFSTNQHSISLGYGTNDGLGDYITTIFSPEKDRYYDIKAVREQGIWSLYVDNSLIGTAIDTLNISTFHQIHLPMVGSVIIDDINVTIEIPDTEEAENNTPDLLNVYAPVIYMHPEEAFAFKEINSLLENSDLKKGNNLLLKTGPINSTDLIANNDASTYIDMDLVDINNEYELPSKETFEPYRAKIYGRITEDENNYTHLQYFMFYPFQKWMNMNHEGDWELVQVTLNPADTIESVSYFFDMFTMTYYDTDLISFVNTTHPVVYVAKGSHNNYGTTESIPLTQNFLFFSNLLGRFKEIEKISQDGEKIFPKILDSEGYDIEEIWSTKDFVAFEGLWGQKSRYYLKNGQSGPKFQGRFRHAWLYPERMTYAPNIPFVSVFIYSPVDANLIDTNNTTLTEESNKLLFSTGKDNEPEILMAEGKNYTLKLAATGDGQFTLETYFYDNDTDSGIMLRYDNITIRKETKGTLNLTEGSLFIMALDDNEDGKSDRFYLPEHYITHRFEYVPEDKDNDTIPDFADNCVHIPNKDQSDFNANHLGDVCDNPRYYKKKAIETLRNTKAQTLRAKVILKQAEYYINKSLEDQLWKSDFEIKSYKVFLYEISAALQLKKIAPEASNYLVKADRLILEYMRINYQDDDKKDRKQQRESDEDHVSSILSYKRKWENRNNN